MKCFLRSVFFSVLPNPLCDHRHALAFVRRPVQSLGTSNPPGNHDLLVLVFKSRDPFVAQLDSPLTPDTVAPAWPPTSSEGHPTVDTHEKVEEVATPTVDGKYRFFEG